MFLLAFAESIQLFPDGTIFIHIALVLLMIWLLNRTFFRPINNVIEARNRRKFGDGGEAAGILRDVEAKGSEYRRSLLEARSEGYDLIEKEQKKTVSAHDKKLETVKKDLVAKSEAGRAEIEKLAAEARKDIEADAAKMADSIAANILGS
jgi:F0F1-type ATP synthase membrane subunit b/b'